MNKIKFGLLSLLAALLFAGYASATPFPALASQPATLRSTALVGAWQATVIHDFGSSVMILSFAPDGTFYSSGDTQHVLSVAQGVWKPVGDGEYDAFYTTPLFDGNQNSVGFQKIRIRITLTLDGKKFAGATHMSTQIGDGVEALSELALAAQRIEDDSAQ